MQTVKDVLKYLDDNHNCSNRTFENSKWINICFVNFEERLGFLQLETMN